MLDLETMRSFMQVAETKSFSKAAQNLHKTSATISYRIKILEETIGTPLFIRTTRFVKLTAAGEYLLNQCNEWVIWLEQMPNALQQINDGVERQIKITINNLLYNVPTATKLLIFLNQEFPFTQFHLSRQVFMGVWDKMIYDNYHLAIGVPSSESLSNNISVFPLGNISWVFIVASKHPLTKLKGIIPENILRQYPAINIEDTARNLQKRTAWLLKGQKEIKVPTMRTKLSCHLSGLGIGFLPRNICRPYLESGELVELQIYNHRPPSPMSLAWNTATMGKTVQKIVELFETNHDLVHGFFENIDIPPNKKQD